VLKTKIVLVLDGSVCLLYKAARSGLSLHLEIVRQDRSSPYCEQVFGYCSVPLWFGGLLLLKSQQQCVSGAEHVFEQLSLPVMLPTYRQWKEIVRTEQNKETRETVHYLGGIIHSRGKHWEQIHVEIFNIHSVYFILNSSPGNSGHIFKKYLFETV